MCHSDMLRRPLSRWYDSIEYRRSSSRLNGRYRNRKKGEVMTEKKKSESKTYSKRQVENLIIYTLEYARNNKPVDAMKLAKELI